MKDATTRRLGQLGWGLTLALLLGSPEAALAVNQPDLVLIDLSIPPTSALPGGSFSASARVKNRGAATAVASTTGFALVSVDGLTRKPLVGVQPVPTLAAGDTSETPTTVAIAPGTPSGLYYLESCADTLAEVAESSEINNCRRTSQKINVLPLPDLIVTSLTDPPLLVAPGKSFKVTSTVQNTGLVSAPVATTRYALVSTTSPATADLDGAQSVPTLGAGQSFTDEETLTLKADTPLGEYQLRACADAGQTIVEEDESDNCRFAVGTVRVSTKADLALSGVTVLNAPVTVSPGGNVTIAAQLDNTGADDAPESTIKFVLVSTAPGSATKNLKGTAAIAPLASGGHVSTQTTVKVFSDTAVGTYTVLACADGGELIQETSELNNCAAAVGTVTVTPIVVLPKPDLVVTSLTKPPSAALPGQSFAITAAVKNQGLGPSALSATKFYVVSVDGLIKKNLKGLQNIPELAAGASANPTVTIKIYSDTLPASYRLQACADGGGDIAETDDNNNCLVVPDILKVQPPPDLLVTAVSNPPKAATQGQAINVTSTIKNVGTGSADPSTTRYYLVPSGGTGKIDLKGKPPVPALDPGDTFTGRDTVKVRAETAPGDYFLQACADTLKVLAEKDENNNCLTSVKTINVTVRPDLVVTAAAIASPTPEIVPLGTLITVEFEVTNKGEGPAAESAMRFFLVDTTTGVTKDLKGHPTVGDLASGKFSSRKSTVKVFTDTLPGTYGLKACADYNELVAETDEENNCLMAKETIVVQ